MPTPATQTLSDFMGNHLSVMMFGATGLGAVDDSTAFQAAINRYAPITAPIAGQSNANPAVITASSGLSVGSVMTVTISGYTGSWAAANGTWGATVLTSSTFSIPVDSTAFGAAAGTPIMVVAGPGSRIFVPKGTYILGAVYMRSQVSLDCAAGVVFLANSNSETMFTFSDNVSQSRISGGCTISANGKTGFRAIAATASAPYPGIENHFRDILIVSPDIGVQTQNLYFSTFHNVRVTSPTTAAFMFEVNSNSLSCINCSAIATSGNPFGYLVHNSGNFTAMGGTIEGTCISQVYQQTCANFVGVYFEDTGATFAGGWVQVGNQTGSFTTGIAFIGCLFNEGAAYALDIYQVNGLVVKGCFVNTSTAAFLVENGVANCNKIGFDVGGNEYFSSVPIWKFANHQTQDLSSSITQDTACPLKFIGSSDFGTTYVPPDGSLQNGQASIYVDPTNGLLSARYQDGSLDDVTSAGAYTGASGSHTWTIVVTAAGTPDTIEWQKDGGAFTTGVSLTGSNQTMSDGVAFRALATTGHTVGTTWNITENSYPISISNTTNPALLRDGSGVGLVPGASITVVISGYTGSWAAANGTWTATVLDVFDFTIPLNATSLGTATGTPIFSVISAAQKAANASVSIGADRFYFNPAALGDAHNSLSYLLDGIDGGLIKGFGGVRISRAQGGTSESSQSMIQAGGHTGAGYFSGLLLGQGKVIPLTGASHEIQSPNGTTIVDIQAGSGQGSSPLLRTTDVSGNEKYRINPDGSLTFHGVTVSGAPTGVPNGTVQFFTDGQSFADGALPGSGLAPAGSGVMAALCNGSWRPMC